MIAAASVKMGTVRGQEQQVLENLRKQLGVAVRSVQWSYAIFWSLSTTQQGVLEWREGYYNGDIKTRKLTGAAEDDSGADHKLGLRRSEELKGLYKSLLEEDHQSGEIEEGRCIYNRPCASLSPEDLSNLEWYYLVCMSFVFKPGQGLPGGALASGQSIWLCNAQHADSKVFSRSLLAKSASVQTIVCFPHTEGVVELGTTEMVPENPNLIQHIKTMLLEFAKAICSNKSFSQHRTDNQGNDIGACSITDMDHEPAEPNEEAFRNLYPFSEEINFTDEMVKELCAGMSDEEELNNTVPDHHDCSNTCRGSNNLNTEDSFMLEENDDLNVHYHIRDSINSSGCLSQAFETHDRPVCPSTSKNVSTALHLQELEVFNATRFGTLDLANKDADEEDLHYKRIVAIVLQNPPRLAIEGQSPPGGFDRRSSCFVPWKREAIRVGRHNNSTALQVSPQRTLKKVLFTLPLMIARSNNNNNNVEAIASEKQNEDNHSCPLNSHADNSSAHNNDNSLFKKCKENEKYMVLGSLVPAINKVDKTSILNNTIDYLKELEARVDELESYINPTDSEARGRRKQADTVEQTSDNYDDDKSGKKKKKPFVTKRKACDIDESEADPQFGTFVPAADNAVPLETKVSFRNEHVVIEVSCPWREYLLLDIIDTVNSLNLDAHTVHSSTLDGVFNLKLFSKFRGAAFASAGMIKRAIRRKLCYV